MLNRVLRYYRDFWNIYQLGLKAQEMPIKAEFSPRPETGSESFSLVVLESRDESQTQAFFQALKSQRRQPGEVIFLRRGLEPSVGEISCPMTIFETQNLPDGKARNQGIQAAAYSIVVLAETSVLPDDSWLENLLAPLIRDPALAFCIGNIAASHRAGRLLANLYASEAFSAGVSPLACATSLAMRKIWWARLGGYPEDIPGFASAAIFAERIKAREITYARSQVSVTWKPGSSVFQTTKRIFQLAEEEGQIGLHATTIWKQVKFVFATLLLTLAVLALALASPFTGFLSLAGSLFLLGGWTQLWGRALLRDAEIKRSLPYGWLACWLSCWRFLGYAWGVRKRKTALESLNGQAARHLKEIVAAHPERKGIVVYFPTHDWGHMFQRPHQMARHFAKAGYLFFYCTKNAISDTVAEFQPVETNLWLMSMPGVPPEIFQTVEPVILYIGAAWHAPLLNFYPSCLSIYDHYDDLKVSAAREEDHDFLLEHANIVIVSSQKLLETVQAVRPDALFIPNAVDDQWVGRFRPDPQVPPPADFAPILQTGKPIIGYSGALAEWFDYPLLAEVARQRPEWEFVLLGVDYDHSLGQSGILNQHNVHWLGQKTYAQLFHYVWRFHVAMIPFRINEITLATSPIKLYEYFYCRKPIVSTSLPEVMRYNQVFIADTPKTFANQIEEALKRCTSAEYQDAIQNVARANTWEQRVQQVIIRLNEIHLESGGCS